MNQPDPGRSAVPTPLSERAVGPDLARGAMLLLIAVANVHIWIFSAPSTARGYVEGSTLDAVLAAVQTVLADGPGLPLFAAVLGFGIAHLAARGADRATFGRRGLIMIGIGLVHGILLFPGEILAAYGLITLLVAPLLIGPTAMSSTTLLRIAGGAAIIPVLLGTGQATVGQGIADTSLLSSSFGAVFVVHPALWLNYVVVSMLFGLPGALVGVVAARRRLLDDPEEHRATLRRWAVLGGAGMVVLGAPLGAVAAGWWVPGPDVAVAVGALHVIAGYAGVFGYLGLFGLLGTVRFPGRATLAAAGTWSMTLYVSQSVVFAVLFPVWALGLGAVVTVAQASAIGLATWLVGVVAAGRLTLAGLRGPLELLVRRVTYARRRVPA